MPTAGEWWGEFWGKVKHSPAILPITRVIPPDHTDKPDGERFRRDAHYFHVTVNRIFLKYDRELWVTYAPMALVVSEFQYDGEDLTVPSIVGPSLLEKSKIELPDTGFVFQDTRVAGIYPYKGGGLKLTIILYKVKRTDSAKQLLKVVERLSAALDFSQVLTTYLKIADVLADTVSEVIGSDKENQPLIGFRKEFAAGDDFKPGYLAIIDSPAVDDRKLWVREKELVFGDNKDTAPQFTTSNFVLCNIGQETERDDFEKFSPIREMWKQVKTEATRPKPEAWETAKIAMSALYQAMVLSPDLTEDHANVLNDDLVQRMLRMHERALGNVRHGEARETEGDRLAPTRHKALDILKL